MTTQKRIIRKKTCVVCRKEKPTARKKSFITCSPQCSKVYVDILRYLKGNYTMERKHQ